MKKLTIIAAIVCAAAVSQAASIKWGGDFATADAGDLDAGSYAYLVKTDSAAAFSLLTLDADTGTWNTDGGSVVASYALSSSDYANYRFEQTYGVAGQAVDGYYHLVIVNGGTAGDGVTGSYTYLGQNTVTDPTSSSVPDLTVGDGWASGTADWAGSGGFSSVTFTAAVPEPTSGLLILLGMAGLMLKRKQA